METLRVIHSQLRTKFHRKPFEEDSDLSLYDGDDEQAESELPERRFAASGWEDASLRQLTGEFFKGLSASAIRDFKSSATFLCCPAMTVLLKEEQPTDRILFLLEGRVVLSMNSFNGRRLILGIATSGEILGLGSAVSGNVSELSAEARYPCAVATLHRRDFLDFLVQYPVSSRNVARELSYQCARASARLRIIGLGSSVQAKLARLLLDWCADGRQTENSAHIRLILTHEEIGECMGTCRETVTRTLADFKSRELVELRGSTLIIPDRIALASYAGIA